MCSSFQIFDDKLVENDETVGVMAAFVQSSPEISFISNTITTTITDNDCKHDGLHPIISYTFNFSTFHRCIVCMGES